MKRNIVIAAVTAAALIGGGTATALATTGDDDPGTTRQTDVRDASEADVDGGGVTRVSSAKVTVADAVASALREAPGAAVSAELDDFDRDDGDDGDGDESAAWEVDVLAGDGTWHSVRVDPATGEVLGSHTEKDEDDTAEARAALKGTSVSAAEAARAAAGKGTVTSVELDDGDDGDKAAWEVETRSSGDAEQDWRVDLKTGKVTADRSSDSDSGSDGSGSDDSRPDDD
ncbi:PepSY domain-containing protein [Streptomyces sp. AC627_RSS907]|uniref:PepSY domain-containing protein n=1 Tax=Streptomyces sp. AC627_RSS907 TaxID=2823684 RepID=UPI001C22DFE6|nr:PepSY domain-containing protein [Streptomyces sp. AC627_RSS907]